MQGILARIFNSGSLVFVTSTWLEVGYVGGGAAAGRGVVIGGGGVSPTVVKGKRNMFWDILEPGKAREVLMQADRVAGSFPATKNCNFREKMAERTALHSQQPAPAETIADKLEKPKNYSTRARTKEEYEKAKKNCSSNFFVSMLRIQFVNLHFYR
jgi:hypothetical protein